MTVGLRNSKIAKEHIRKHGVVMLTRMHNDVLMASVSERRGDRGELDELGPGSNHAHDLHLTILSRFGQELSGPMTRE